MPEIEPGITLETWNEGQLDAPQFTYRSFLVGAQNGDPPNIFYVHMRPDQTVPRHAHAGWTVNVVLQGSLQMGDIPMKVGDVLTCVPGAQYGPMIPGPEGVTLMEVVDKVSGQPATWYDPNDPAAMAVEAWRLANSPIRQAPG